MKNKAPDKYFLYERIAKNIEQQILKGILKIGDRVPSLRIVCREYGVSQSTALQAYYLLESQSLIEARPQSGYFVCNSPKKMLDIPPASKPSDYLFEGTIDSLVSRVYDNIGLNEKYIPLSLGVPAMELLPTAKLNKCLVQATRQMEGCGVSLEHPQGNEKLRKQIVRWAFAMEANLSQDNIITTSGCLNAISYCLMALTEPGDTIVLESPISFGMIQVAQSLKLNIIELPCHTETGIDLTMLEETLRGTSVKLILLISNFSNPVGSCMPDENKKLLVELIEKYHIPLIENDINADVYFGSQRPKSCKTFDKNGLVLWCGSVSKSLAPGYRVGWVEPGRFKEQVLKKKLYHGISTTGITEEAIAIFLENGRYEAHLRKLRNQVHLNYLHYVRAINEFFPEGTKASRPGGGFVLWLELDKRIDTVELYERAINRRISIAPGKMFTLRNQFGNCLRLNFGLNWDEQTSGALRILGQLAKDLLL
ncbi:PLP-dependent aminotransferase family protein [Emticicia sp. BO119]|uniref:aminotransferase-like domain-containing protein n=1 Tax=Emticicia sp. BO119 TaxID=2757768 RepID=UPI0015F09841|nr:PLP-dependent aminotransferase family protein [Emticicia sp. BO119]MBA4850833.1 PLP-dependent aminotransferase family protein [Emticicia sp. BO119]